MQDGIRLLGIWLRHLRNRLLILQELIGWDHRDAIPRADLVAEGAADAAGEVDGADLKNHLVARAGNEMNAIDGADGHAGFAAGAHVFVEEGEDLRKLLLSHFERHGRGARATTR